MTLRRPLLVALLLAAALLAALASGGFSASELDRNVEVQIVDDGAALVDLDVTCRVIEHTDEDGTVTNTEFEVQGHVTNTLGGDIVIEEVEGYDQMDAVDGYIGDTDFEITFGSSPTRITVRVSMNRITARITTTDVGC